MNRSPAPTLADVARQAGVSAATVSRVLNRTAPVSEDIRTRVEEAVLTLGYKQKGLSAGPLPQGTLALFIPTTTNPYYSEVIQGVEDEAEIDGMSLLLVSVGRDVRRGKRALDLLRRQPVDGVLFCGTTIPSQDMVALHDEENMYVVVLNRQVNHPQVPSVTIDAATATYRATLYLLSLNHVRIAYLDGHIGNEGSLVRKQGIELALAEARLSLPPQWCVTSAPTIEGGFQAMSTLLAMNKSNQPTAVIAFNDLMAVGALHAMRVNGLSAPADMSVIGFDGISLSAHTNPPLTTVDQPKYRLGQMGVQLIRQMREGLFLEHGYVLLESNLVIRESTGPAPR